MLTPPSIGTPPMGNPVSTPDPWAPTHHLLAKINLVLLLALALALVLVLVLASASASASTRELEIIQKFLYPHQL